MKTITIKHNLGDIIFLKTDKEQKQRIITAVTYRQTGLIYSLSCGIEESSHYDFEISLTEDILLKIE